MQSLWFFVCVILWNCVVADFPCGVPKIQHTATIKGGSSTKHGEWPWHAAIYHKEGRSVTYACGGTLISEDYVLTAAHCLFNENTFQLLNRKRISVRFGIHNLDEINANTMKEFPVQTMHMFNNFSREDLRNDIALLELAEVVRFSNYILPACLNANPVIAESTGTSIGWGLTDNDEISPSLKKVDLPIIDSVNCLISDRDYFGHTIDHNMFCAGHKNGSTVCNGDSGGGLFLKQGKSWHLTGIVSFIKKRPDHTNFCSTDTYAGFTNVADYIPWIKSITNIQVKRKTTSCGQRKLVETFSVDEISTENKHEYNWPWHGALFKRVSSSQKYRCAVTVLAKKLVVTAAHCVDNVFESISATDFYVKVGLSKNILGKARFNQEHDVRTIMRHSDFTPEINKNDIAFLQLYSAIMFTDHVQPICLWKGDSSLTSILGNVGHLVTWTMDDKDHPNLYEESTIQTRSVEVCLKTDYIRHYNLLNEQNFCADFVNGTTEIDHAGAGLYYLDDDQWMLRGILSAGAIDPESLKPDLSRPLIFTDLAYYLTADTQQDFPTVLRDNFDTLNYE